MKIHLHQLVEKYNFPKTWLANQCGFSRTQLANWVAQPDKYPIPADKKVVVQKKLRELGEALSNVELK